MKKRSALVLLVTQLIAIIVLADTTLAYPADESIVNEQHLQAIENYMNAVENPCNDFFQFACGNWVKHHQNAYYTESLSLTDHNTNKKLVKLLEAYKSTDAKQNIYDKVWTYYQSCIREKEFKVLKYVQLVQPAENVSWALMHTLQQEASVKWPSEQFNWMLTLAKLRRYELNNVFIEHLVLERLEDSTQYIIDLDSGGHGYKLPNLLTVVVLLKELGTSTKAAISIAKDIAGFHKSLMELVERIDDGSALYITVAKLESEMPELPWRKYLQIVLNNETISDSFELQLRNWKYFKSLIKFMQDAEPTIVSHYIMMRFMLHISADSASNFGKVECVQDLRSKMDFAINYIYKQQFYAAEAEIYELEVHRIFKLIRQEFTKKLDQNNLQLSIAETEALRQKLNKMHLNIGNLPTNTSGADADAYYSGAQFNLASYYENHLSLLAVRTQQQHMRLTSRTNAAGDEYFFIADSDVAKSSAPFYVMRHNVIIVPYGILQAPMFDKNMHDVFKMSMFGFLLAHELTHGFDVNGLAYNFRGNEHSLAQSINNNRHFTNGLRCLQQSETESVAERIADISGIRIAYDVLFASNATLSVQQPNFTQIPVKRLFFLNFAHFFCGNLAATFTAHDADNIRVQQTLINLAAFAETFECQLGTEMHPSSTKCRLW